MKHSDVIFSNTFIFIRRKDFFGLLFKLFVKINYRDITNVIVFNAINAEGKKAFKGSGDFWNYFPSGLKMNEGEKVFLIQQKYTKWKIGFSLAKWENFVTVLQDKRLI